MFMTKIIMKYILSLLSFFLFSAFLPAEARSLPQDVVSSSVKMRSHRLTAFPAEIPAGGDPAPAVIVCPGGSYSWLDMETEGEGVARWLQANGISAFVLKYRVQGPMSFALRYRYLVRGHQYPDALNDLQQALRYVRNHAGALGIDPTRLGVMGFSAGGHLVVNAAQSYPNDTLRPDFVASLYPVVTLRQEPYVHKRSRRALLGEYRKNDIRWHDSLSLETHVRPDMPPVFLVNCVDDPIVHYHNSELLDSALTAHGVPHEYHQYKTGGHGFGSDPAKASVESIVWREEFLRWFGQLPGRERTN